LEREPFIGQAALKEIARVGPKWQLVGLEYDWETLERAFASHDLPPEIPHGAWRTPIPVYAPGGRQVGQATSGTWASMIKKNIALATIESSLAAIGTGLQIELTVEYERLKTPVTVAKPMFFNPSRKRD
jgi:aminomethyltransferase